MRGPSSWSTPIDAPCASRLLDWIWPITADLALMAYGGDFDRSVRHFRDNGRGHVTAEGGA